MRRQDPRGIPGFDDHGPCPVTEEDAGTAIAPVDDPRQGINTDDQGPGGAATADELVGDTECIYETGTDGLQVKGRATVMDSKPIL